MVPDIHAKFHNEPFIMCRGIWRHVRGHTHAHTHIHNHIETKYRYTNHNSSNNTADKGKTLQIQFTLSKFSPCRLISEFPSNFQSPLNLRYTGLFLLISSPLPPCLLIALIHSSSLFSTSSLLVLHNTMSSAYNTHHGDQNHPRRRKCNPLA